MQFRERQGMGSNTINGKNKCYFYKTIIASLRSTRVIIIIIIIICKRVYTFLAVTTIARVHIYTIVWYNSRRLVKIDQLRINRWRSPINRPRLWMRGDVDEIRFISQPIHLLSMQYMLVDFTRYAHVSADS